MAKGDRQRARSRAGEQGRLPPAQAAAIRHVRWIAGRILGLRRLPSALRRRPLRGRSGAPGPALIAAGARPPVAGRRARAWLASRAPALHTSLRRGLHRGRRALGRALGLLGRAALALGRALVARRDLVLGVLQRGLWWSALALFVVGGRDLLNPYEGTLTDALPAFIVGFSLCALAILLAATRRIRWAALALGFGHGALGLLLWTVLNG